MRETVLADGSPALASDGAPSDCVALGVMGLLADPVDLVVSGINPNANVGQDMTYSGTVTAAMEAVIAGIPGVAFSLDRPYRQQGEVEYGTAAGVARRVIQLLTGHPLPPTALFNVNIPHLPDDQIRGYRVTRQGRRIYNNELVSRTDPRGYPYYWIGGKPPTGIAEDGTDFGALAAGYVSITPLHLDLTDHALIERMRTWEEIFESARGG